MAVIGVIAIILACAAFIPDYNQNKVVNKEKKADVEIVMTPVHSPTCDDKSIPLGQKHYKTFHIRVNQHNTLVYKWVFMIDNGKGVRFSPAQTVGGKYTAGIGVHEITVGLYTEDGDGNKTVTWQRHMVVTVKCCHPEDNQESRYAEET